MKYRIYNKRENKYCKPNFYLLKSDGSIYSIEESDSDANYLCLHLESPEVFIVERCTDEKDIRGNLIFENDVVKQRDGRTGKVILWLESDGRDWNGWMMEGSFIGDGLNGSEIIGNVHNKNYEIQNL